jgi:hypothetical protein
MIYFLHNLETKKGHGPNTSYKLYNWSNEHIGLESDPENGGIFSKSESLEIYISMDAIRL